MPLVFKDDYYKPIEKNLRYYFHEIYWSDILALFDDPIYNSNSALITAIRTGKVQYRNGEFRGTFNARISRELSKFSKFNGVKKVWVGIAPPEVSAAAAMANSQMTRLSQRITAIIGGIPQNVSGGLPEMNYDIAPVIERMGKVADSDVIQLGLTPNYSPALNEKIVSDYKNNMDINIQNWTEEQTENLRDMINRNIAAGYNKQELIRAISSEYDTTMKKARFLARQETSLLMSTITEERYQSAGIEFYRWSTSQDSRVVGTPSGLYPRPTSGHGNHYLLQGKICRMNDPTVYADSIQDAKAGKWKSKLMIGAGDKHPGQEYLCRCVRIPVI